MKDYILHLKYAEKFEATHFYVGSVTAVDFLDAIVVGADRSKPMNPDIEAVLNTDATAYQDEINGVGGASGGGR